MGSALFDSSDSLPGELSIPIRQVRPQRAEVYRVLRPIWCDRQQLRRDEMTRLRDGDRDTAGEVQPVGRAADVALDSRRCEEQIDDDAVVRFSRGNQADGGEASKGLMLQRQADPVPAGDETRNQIFRVRIVADGDGQIDVACESRFTADGDGESADKCPWLVLRVKRAGRLPKDGEQARGAQVIRHGSSRRGPSPISAPGRSCNHRPRSAST